MSELRVGGLALIIQSRIPENIGVTVRLLKNLGVVSGVIENKEFEAWHVESTSCVKLRGYLPGGLVIDTKEVNCPAKWLMPIDGEDFSHEDEHQKELTHG